jgi:hypothetical protein
VVSSYDEARHERAVGLNDDVGFGGSVPPLFGGLLRAFRSRRTADSPDDEFRITRGAKDRVPNNAQLSALMQDGLLVLPPRYFVGFFLDMLI